MPAQKFLTSLLLIALSCVPMKAQNAPPVLTAVGNQIYCPGTQTPIVTQMTFTDPDDNAIDAIYIQISSGYQLGQDQLILTGNHPTIAASWNATEGKLTLKSPGNVPVLYSDFKAAIEAIIFTSSAANPSGNRTFSISVGQANYLPSTQHYYAYVPALGINWTDAKIAAENSTYYGLQGYLATITAADEAQLSGKQAAGAGWIGGSDAAQEGVWKWVTGPEAGTTFWLGDAAGSTPNFAFWNVGEPNNLGNENYAHVTAPGVGTAGSWNDLSNTGAASGDYQPKGYIVEYGGMPGDPVLHIATSTSLSIPSIASTTAASRCGSGTVTLGATGTGNIKWFDSATGGNLLAAGNNFTTPSLSATTTFYVDPFEPGCTTATRTPVMATINEIPILQVTTPAASCAGTVTIQATTTAGQIRWYGVPDNGTLLATGTSFTTPALTQNTTYYVEALNNGCTSGPRQPVTVNIIQAPVVQDEQVALCENDQAILDAGIDNATYLWSTGATSKAIVVNAAGTYSVAVTNANGCSSTKTITVTVKSAPVISNVKVSGQTVMIELSNTGSFEYAIDQGNYQASNIFSEVSGGLHTAHVRQVDFCGSDQQDFVVLLAPRFFTPNGDSVNDTFSVPGLSFLPQAELSVFDRYGKLLTTLTPSRNSWDGRLNGRALPADDYWYVLKNGNAPTVRGHFSLIR